MLGQPPSMLGQAARIQFVPVGLTRTRLNPLRTIILLRGKCAVSSQNHQNGAVALQSQFIATKKFMDAFLTVLIDGVCHLSGKGVCWLLRKIGLPVPPLSFGGYVVVGLVAIVALIALLIVGALYV